ncbi:hypothetical protein HMSSN036_83450 [Paenibacillus macerans]|nr:hypothetical protein HMSSN036_83450 [Paenibacillus macerans]
MPMKKQIKWPSYALFFILPSFILYTLFVIVPTLGSIYYSFTSWDGISADVRFIGLANFVEIWNSPRVHNALKNTLILTISLVVLENLFAVLLAMLVDKSALAEQNIPQHLLFPHVAQRYCDGVRLGDDAELQLRRC